MQTLRVLSVILAIAVAGHGARIVLRNHAVLEGEVLERTDDYVVVQQADGVVTCGWRYMTTHSFKEVHPDLYHKLLTQAMERAEAEAEKMRAQGLVKVGDAWLSKEEAQAREFAAITMRVVERDDGTSFSLASSSSDGRTHMRSCWSEIHIALEGLDPSTRYVLKTEYSTYTRPYGTSASGDGTRAGPFTETTTISATQAFEIVYKSEAVTQSRFKFKGVEGTSVRHSRQKSGKEPNGVDVSIWLNHTLVYEKKKDKPAVYHHVKER
jgi:hypothetical protein